MSSKTLFLLLLCLVHNNVSEPTPEQREALVKLSAVFCVEGLPADKAQVVTECENTFPKAFKDVYGACVKTAFGADQTLATFCYKLRPDSDKLTACLKAREEEAAANGMRMDPKIVENYRNKYMTCYISKGL